VGRIELRNLDALNDHRREVAARYNERLDGVVQIPTERPWAHHVYHIYAVRTERRDALAEFLKTKGIGTGIHYPLPNHQQPAITKLYSNLPRLPKTEEAAHQLLSLPMYGDLPLEDVDYVCDAILEFFGKN
jgi:dTDP-4-amino-4,6-dideoxygalactose transaminase